MFTIPEFKSEMQHVPRGKLSPEESKKIRERYRKIIKEGDQECPAPVRPEGEKKRGRLKRTKARNLLERLKDFEEDVLRFMDNELVPFTNKQGKPSGLFNPQDSGILVSFAVI